MSYTGDPDPSMQSSGRGPHNLSRSMFDDYRPLFDDNGVPIVYDEPQDPSIAAQASEEPDIHPMVLRSDDVTHEPVSLKERGLTILRTAARVGEAAVRNTVDYLLHDETGKEISLLAVMLGTATLAMASEIAFPGHGAFELVGNALQGLGNLAMHGTVNAARFVQDLPTLEHSSDPAVNGTMLKLWGALAVPATGYFLYAWLASGPHRRDDY